MNGVNFVPKALFLYLVFSVFSVLWFCGFSLLVFRFFGFLVFRFCGFSGFRGFCFVFYGEYLACHVFYGCKSARSDVVGAFRNLRYLGRVPGVRVSWNSESPPGRAANAGA